MNRTLRLCTALLLLNTGSSVFASTATEMTLSGLVTPSSCTIALSGSGIIDHGTIPAHLLNQVESLITRSKCRRAMAVNAACPLHTSS